MVANLGGLMMCLWQSTLQVTDLICELQKFVSKQVMIIYFKMQNQHEPNISVNHFPNEH